MIMCIGYVTAQPVIALHAAGQLTQVYYKVEMIMCIGQIRDYTAI